jgi:hypothetical protein
MKTFEEKMQQAANIAGFLLLKRIQERLFKYSFDTDASLVIIQAEANLVEQMSTHDYFLAFNIHDNFDGIAS